MIWQASALWLRSKPIGALLSMFNNLPSLLRLSLCLFLSTGLHGGLFFYDWMTSPVESRLAHAPVVVAFLPAVDLAAPAVIEQAQESPVPAPSSVQPRPVEAKPAKTIARPPVSAPRQALSKTLPGKPAPAAIDKLKDAPKLKPPAAEMVCLPPQEVVSDPPPVLFAGSQPSNEPVEAGATLTEAANPATPTELPGEQGPLDSAAPAAHALIEAIPNYRSNPLPEYPYLARQKHWEGVVWLMVDVSADGLVDDLRVERSCGHQVLDRAARRAVSRWQFSPAKRAGLPVSSQVRIPVRFRLEDG